MTCTDMYNVTGMCKDMYCDPYYEYEIYSETCTGGYCHCCAMKGINFLLNKKIHCKKVLGIFQ